MCYSVVVSVLWWVGRPTETFSQLGYSTTDCAVLVRRSDGEWEDWPTSRVSVLIQMLFLHTKKSKMSKFFGEIAISYKLCPKF